MTIYFNSHSRFIFIVFKLMWDVSICVIQHQFIHLIVDPFVTHFFFYVFFFFQSVRNTDYISICITFYSLMLKFCFWIEINIYNFVSSCFSPLIYHSSFVIIFLKIHFYAIITIESILFQSMFNSLYMISTFG
jgi:hypothetical protein